MKRLFKLIFGVKQLSEEEMALRAFYSHSAQNATNPLKEMWEREVALERRNKLLEL